MTLTYPDVPDKIIDWGPGVHHFGIGAVDTSFDMDVAVSLERSSRWTDLPDREDEDQQRREGTVAVLGLHATQEKGDPSVTRTFVELTGGDCLNLATWLLAAIEAAGGATRWIVTENDPLAAIKADATTVDEIGGF